MSRPAVSVVVPFAGDAQAASDAIAMLTALRTCPGDELILCDNSGTAPEQGGAARREGGAAPPGASSAVLVVRAAGERSPAHARNAGAAHAHAGWILFLDADTRAPADLLGRYFATDIAPAVGILAGEIRPAPGPGTLAARYGAARSFLDQRAHLAHPFRPRAAAANLLVRRAAFEAAGGFREGLRAAEDTDFCWRAQALGWTLELRADADVEHAYRTTIPELRRQWRAYAAGRAWLAREYPGFHPEPAAARALRRAGARIPFRHATARVLRRVGARIPLGHARSRGDGSPPEPVRQAPGPRARGLERPPRDPVGKLERLQFLALDVLLAVEELIGLRLSNSPKRGRF